MKRLLLIYFLFLINYGYSQVYLNINAAYNWAEAGNNIESAFQITNNRSSFTVGLFYHTGSKNFKEYDVFKDRYKSLKFINHFGISCEYKYNLINNEGDIKPFLFYNFNYFKSNISLLFLTPYGYYNNKQLYTISDDGYTNPLPVIENNAGLGVKFKLYKKLDMFAKAGAGIGFFYLDKDAGFVYYNFWEWSVITLFGIGISYNF